MRIRFFIVYFLLFIFYTNELVSQKIGIWVFGSTFPRMDTAAPDTGLGYSITGANLLNFNPFSVTRKFKTLSLNWNVTNMWDKNRNLQFYTNGSKIFNNEHKLMDRGDSLKHSKFWGIGDWGYLADQNSFLGIYPSSIVCPHPTNQNQYYLFYINDNYDSAIIDNSFLKFTNVVYCLIDMSFNNGRGKVIEKERKILYGDFSPTLAATKHANGRDWWIAARGYQDTNCYYFFYLDPTGVRYRHKQCLGYNFDSATRDRCYGLNFNSDGKQLAKWSKKGLEVFDFDRCTGKLSNLRQAPYPYATGSYDDYQRVETYQVGFSPNGQYVYTISAGFQDGTSSKRVYQLDTKASDFAASAVKVAECDKFRDTFGTDPNQAGWETSFFSIQIAPDNKIYLGTGEQTRYLHVIEEPDKKGLACNFKQHAIKLLTAKAAIPMYPNYALGADSSSCSSGIAESEQFEVKVYPNPVSDCVYISLSSKGIATKTGIYMYNLLGQEIPCQARNDGSDILSIDVRDLPEGIYLLHIRDKQGSLVKTERIVISR
jgi:hypothetical protein